MFDLGIGVWDVVPFIVVGFAAQVIDGALGMAFGVISQTMLVSVLGVAPAAASASTHLVEIFTTGASGASHIVHRNVDWGLFKRLVPFGIVGGVLGAYVLSNIDASVARPYIMLYLTGIGFYLLVKAIRMSKPRFEDPRMTRPLALTGGFLDAAGRDLQPAGTGRRSGQGDRHRQYGRVPAVALDLDLVHRRAGLQCLQCSDDRDDRGRRHSSSVRGLAGEEDSAARAAFCGRARPDRHERLQHRQGLAFDSRSLIGTRSRIVIVWAGANPFLLRPKSYLARAIEGWAFQKSRKPVCFWKNVVFLKLAC